jgi:hypothetical protein
MSVMEDEKIMQSQMFLDISELGGRRLITVHDGIIDVTPILILYLF